jgi:hypothetical protein
MGLLMPRRQFGADHGLNGHGRLGPNRSSQHRASAGESAGAGGQVGGQVSGQRSGQVSGQTSGQVSGQRAHSAFAPTADRSHKQRSRARGEPGFNSLRGSRL